MRLHDWAGVNVNGLPAVQRWLAAIASRPAVQRGLGIPARSDKSTRAVHDYLKQFRQQD